MQKLKESVIVVSVFFGLVAVIVLFKLALHIIFYS